MIEPASPSSHLRVVLTCIGYVALHLAAQFSARWFEISPGISVWYPPAGLAFSLLFVLGPRYGGVVFAANVAGALMLPGLPDWWAPLVYPALITINYTAAAWLARRFLQPQLFSGRLRNTLSFAAIVLLSPLGSAVGGILLSPPPSGTDAATFLNLVSRWWLGDVSGMLTVLPVAAVFLPRWLAGRTGMDWKAWRTQPNLSSAIGTTIALVASLWFAFAQNNLLPYGTLYICFLPLCWAGLRHGLPGATLASVVLTMGTLLGLHHAPQSEGYWVSFILFQLAMTVLGLGIGAAVSRRNAAVRELSTSRARFDRVLSGAQLGLWDWNLATGELVQNERSASILRRETAEMPATIEGWEEAIHPADRARNRDELNRHLRGERALYEAEYRIRGAGGRWRWVQSRGSVVARDEAGQPVLVSGTHADITERKLMEAATHRLLAILENSTDFVVTLDPHGRVRYANLALLELHGLRATQELQGEAFTRLFADASVETIQSVVFPTTLNGGVWRGELKVARIGGRPIETSTVALRHRQMDDDASLLSLVMRDITAQKTAAAEALERERQILQLQKTESLGVLAGGVAHDFNNLLTAIFGNASLLRNEQPHLHGRQGPLAQIEVAASRAAELCRNMLAYAGRVRLTLDEVDVNALVRESRELVHATVSRKIALDVDLAPDLPRIRGCASQLQQIIINLALNASEAIGDRPGFIRFRTSHRDLGREEARELLEAPALEGGHYVFLDVEDTGCGIPNDVRQKIFEPFFTTKPRGHGLGLSAVNGIARAHGGAIHVRSEVGHGSVFRVALPALLMTDRTPRPAEAAGNAWHGSGLALVVDDEEMVRTVVCRLVEHLGFQAIAAKDGIEAVAEFRRHHHALRFVLTDLTMPAMNGDEAIVEMHRINPKVPTILMSGYPEKMSPDYFALASPSALLAKPLRSDVLQRTLAQVLEKAGG